MFLDLLQGLCASVVHVLSPQDSTQVSAHNALQVAGEFVSLSLSLCPLICLLSLSLSFLTVLATYIFMFISSRVLYSRGLGKRCMNYATPSRTLTPVPVPVPALTLRPTLVCSRNSTKLNERQN